jgi:hypothetical protein
MPVKRGGPFMNTYREHGFVELLTPDGYNPKLKKVLETFPDIQFYDYTKYAKRAIANTHGEHPANYQLTFFTAPN